MADLATSPANKGAGFIPGLEFRVTVQRLGLGDCSRDGFIFRFFGSGLRASGSPTASMIRLFLKIAFRQPSHDLLP